ncbi:hypothetical protein VP01_2985g2 [Puccinia sorghi]|uniref:Uncharacterized protein n=1 Tax=Puccinia sorghi TaxID=27349 RepID=A0A0L6V0L1_9BASI|nr:hypothetical protein VP01_2985g2 [Puccinia sorghi]
MYNELHRDGVGTPIPLSPNDENDPSQLNHSHHMDNSAALNQPGFWLEIKSKGFTLKSLQGYGRFLVCKSDGYYLWELGLGNNNQGWAQNTSPANRPSKHIQYNCLQENLAGFFDAHTRDKHEHNQSMEQLYALQLHKAHRTIHQKPVSLYPAASHHLNKTYSLHSYITSLLLVHLHCALWQRTSVLVTWKPLNWGYLLTGLLCGLCELSDTGSSKCQQLFIFDLMALPFPIPDFTVLITVLSLLIMAPFSIHDCYPVTFMMGFWINDIRSKWETENFKRTVERQIVTVHEKKKGLAYDDDFPTKKKVC